MSDFSSEDLSACGTGEVSSSMPGRVSQYSHGGARPRASLLTRIPYNELTTRRIAAEYIISVSRCPPLLSRQGRHHQGHGRASSFGDALGGGPRHRRCGDGRNRSLAAAVARLFEAYVVRLEQRLDFRAIAFGQDARGADNRRWAGRGLTKLLVEFMKLGSIDLDPSWCAERRSQARPANASSPTPLRAAHG